MARAERERNGPQESETWRVGFALRAETGDELVMT